jgi:putative NIF3 family GTP cyclohydrolase 1 type 2
MKAKDVQSYLRSLNGGWMDLEETVDTFKAGDPEAEVRGIAVAWMSTTEALKRAESLDCNVFVTHEPTYYNHLDDPKSAVFTLRGARVKRAWIDASGMVIIRCHDLWDQMPEIGIPDAWGQALNLGEAIAGKGYYRVYDVTGRTAGGVAERIAVQSAPFGQPGVQLIGNPEASVTRLAIGTGAITPFFTFIRDYSADLALCTDDGLTYWQHGAYALDAGIPVIIVNHASSEEPGMIQLAKHLERRFPDVPVHHIPQGCMYEVIPTQQETA